MEDSPIATTVTADPKLVSYTHLMYALHAATVVIGIFTSALIVTMFLFGWPSIIAVIMNYLRRGAVRGTWLDSHFSWQLRTFWWALLWAVVVWVVTFPLWLVLIGIPLTYVGLGVVGLWAAYRIIRGWLALKDGRSLPA